MRKQCIILGVPTLFSITPDLALLVQSCKIYNQVSNIFLALSLL